MKQVKIAYDKCKAKMPNRPPDEIDFGLGFRAGLDWIQGQHCRGDWDDGSALETEIKEELQ